MKSAGDDKKNERYEFSGFGQGALFGAELPAAGRRTGEGGVFVGCARLAPSAVNFQPWRFFVVASDARREALRRCYHRESGSPKRRSASRCASTSRCRGSVKSDGHDHADIDAAIAAEHICLAAAEQGLGSCWVCNFDVPLCREALELPATLRPVVLIPVGYPADAPTQRRNASRRTRSPNGAEAETDTETDFLSGNTMKIALFIPCYINALYPQVGEASYRLLRSLGLDVDYPLDQTCCGQPMANAGYERDAQTVGRTHGGALRGGTTMWWGRRPAAWSFVREGYPAWCRTPTAGRVWRRASTKSASSCTTWCVPNGSTPRSTTR